MPKLLDLPESPSAEIEQESIQDEFSSKQREPTGWQEDFSDETFGILADDPIERPSQGDFEKRDEDWEI